MIKNVNVRIDDQLIDQIDSACKKYSSESYESYNRSDFVREAVKEKLAKVKDTQVRLFKTHTKG